MNLRLQSRQAPSSENLQNLAKFSKNLNL